ncbi:MAG TPA: hypothetical protein VGI74_10395, partial [Streptosporangiaceae bacterium]
WRKVSGHPAPRAWVVRTALNAGASWWRRRARELPLTGHDVAAPGSPGPAWTGAAGQARAPGTIRTAAFTLTSNANGTDTLTINPKVLLEPATLQSDLAQYGIQAVVNSGSLCTSDPAPAGFSQVVSSDPAGPWTGTPRSCVQPTITIDPSAMPSGTELSFGYFQLSSGGYAGEQQADVVLIDTGSSTCSSTPPDPNGLPDGYGPSDGIGLLYGGPGPAGS